MSKMLLKERHVGKLLWWLLATLFLILYIYIYIYIYKLRFSKNIKTNEKIYIKRINSKHVKIGGYNL